MWTGKPGRVLWWLSMFSWAFGWLLATINYSVVRDVAIGFSALLFWGAGAFFGTLWLIVKMWQVLCRVRADTLNPAGTGVAIAAPRREVVAGLTGREMLTAVGVGCAVCALALTLWAAGKVATSNPERAKQLDEQQHKQMVADIHKLLSGDRKPQQHKKHVKTAAEHEADSLRATQQLLCASGGLELGPDGNCRKPTLAKNSDSPTAAK
jgi:hypothetical protein